MAETDNILSGTDNPFKDLEKPSPLLLEDTVNPFEGVMSGSGSNSVLDAANPDGVVKPVKDTTGWVEGQYETVKNDARTVSKAMSEAARLGWIGVTELAAAVNRGVVYTADLPPSLVNLVSTALGGPKLSSQLTDFNFIKKATDTGRKLDSFAARAARDSVEFFVSSMTFAGMARGFLQAGEKLAPELPTISNKILTSLATTTPKMEASVAAGGGVGSQLGQEISDNPYVKFAFETGGGLATGGISATNNYLRSKAKKHAAEIVRQNLVDPKQADFNMSVAREDLAPIEAARDIGLNSLFHKLWRRDMAMQNDYLSYVARQKTYLHNELEDMFLLADEGISEGVFQDYLAQHKDFALDTQEMIVQQAQREIDEIVALEGRSTNRVDQSVYAESRMNVAQDDIAEYRNKLWKNVRSAGVPITASTKPLADTGESIVLDFSKGYQPPAELKNTIQLVTGRELVETPDGWKLGEVTDEGSFARLEAYEAVDQIQKSRSLWEAHKETYEQGIIQT